MDEATARQRLELLTQADQDPALILEEINALLEDSRRPDLAGNPPSNVTSADEWASATVVLAGTVVRTSSGRFLRCVIPGTTGTTEPSVLMLAGYTRAGHTFYDGTVTWEDFGTTWAPTYDLDAAAARGWRMKAGKAAGRFDFAEDGQQFTRSQIVAHCHAMAEAFETGSAGTLSV